MVKYSAKSRYGVRILLDIALNRDQGPVRVGDISTRQAISVRYIDRLIQPLKKAGLINSIRGPKGGYLLAKQPLEISLGQVVHIMEGDETPTDCAPSPDIRVRRAEDRILQVWHDGSELMWGRFEKVSLAQLLADRDGGEKADI